MKDLKYIGILSIVFFILIIVYGLYSLLEIFILWTDFPMKNYFFQSNLQDDIHFIDNKHRFVTTIYLLLNIILILPSFWYLKVTKLINKKDYYSPILYSLFGRISTILALTAIIPIFLPRILDLDKAYVKPEFWFNIHPTFIILLAGLLQSFSLILKDAIHHKQENELTI